MMNEMLQVDPGIRSLVLALNEAGIETDWSCAGESGHMTIRPTIQARTFIPDLKLEQRIIERVLQDNGHKDYWLSLVWKRGSMNTHGGEPVWLIELPGRFDFTALNIAYSQKYQHTR